MIRLTEENTARAIERCRELRPKVRFVSTRTIAVQSANNTNVYTVRFDVRGRDKFGVCECRAAERGLVCYHIAAAAALNIAVQSQRKAQIVH